jgi:hypothetical protein
MSATVPSRPIPVDKDDASRVTHSAIRQRMLDGEWQKDGDDMLWNHLGERREGWGVLDMSACPAKQISSELAVLYIKRPTVTCALEGAEDLVGDQGLIRKAGLWTKMQELQRYNWFLREYLIRPDIDPKRKALQYRLVSPQDVCAYARPDEPDRPVKIEELRLRVIDDKCQWTWDVLDVSDTENPSYRVLLTDDKAPEGRRDVTEAVLGGDFSGENYPYRRADKTPVLPYVMYHARDTGKLWNAWDGIEVMIGSLNAAVYWTMAGHAAKDASGRVVAVLGAEVQGVEAKQSPTTGAPVRTMVMEPGTFVFFESSGNTPASVSEIGPGSELKTLEDFAMGYERRIAVMAGINPSDIQRLGGDARSGYAIAISNQGKRAAQEQQVELYRRYDLELLELSAIICNRLLGTTFPETGYNIEYPPIAKTPEEQSAERDEIEFDLSRGFVSPVEALMRRRPGLTKTEAEQALQRNASARAMLRLQSGDIAMPSNGVTGMKAQPPFTIE